MDRNYDLFDLEALYKLGDKNDRMCNLCESHNGPKSDSNGYMCEGRWCDVAVEYLIDDMEDEDLEPFLIERLEKLVKQAEYETYRMLLIRR